MTKNNIHPQRGMVAQMAARSLHDQKVLGSNLAGSYETINLSITKIDGYVVSHNSTLSQLIPTTTNPQTRSLWEEEPNWQSPQLKSGYKPQIKSLH